MNLLFCVEIGFIPRRISPSNLSVLMSSVLTITVYMYMVDEAKRSRNNELEQVLLLGST